MTGVSVRVVSTGKFGLVAAVASGARNRASLGALLAVGPAETASCTYPNRAFRTLAWCSAAPDHSIAANRRWRLRD